jgi:hypothetical protein
MVKELSIPRVAAVRWHWISWPNMLTTPAPYLVNNHSVQVRGGTTSPSLTTRAIVIVFSCAAARRRRRRSDEISLFAVVSVVTVTVTVTVACRRCRRRPSCRRCPGRTSSTSRRTTTASPSLHRRSRPLPSTFRAARHPPTRGSASHRATAQVRSTPIRSWLSRTPCAPHTRTQTHTHIHTHTRAHTLARTNTHKHTPRTHHAQLEMCLSPWWVRFTSSRLLALSSPACDRPASHQH